MELFGKVAVITGGASGIGLATARRLAAAGMALVLADIEPAALDAAVTVLSASGAAVLGVPTDVGEQASVQSLADAAWTRFGAVHLLFNNAGVGLTGPLHTMRHADWEWVLRVNLWGVIHGVEAFVPRMIAQGAGGHIVNTGSFAGLVPNEGLGVYSVSKYGVVALSEVLMREVGRYGIGVSVLCPMRVATRIDASQRNRPDTERAAEIDLGTAADDAYAGRTLTADEVAARVVHTVQHGGLYIHTHAEARPYLRRRFERLDRAFDALDG